MELWFTEKHTSDVNFSIKVNRQLFSAQSDYQRIDVFDSNQIEDPLDTITKREYYSEIENAIDKSLSDFEKKVLNRFAKGESYVQIADKLNTPVKSVDNAIQRIRKKAIRNIVDE